jgi:hypothetical protein
MRDNRRMLIKIISLLILAGLFIMTGCSTSSGPQFTMPVQLSAHFNYSQLASSVSYVVLTVVSQDEILYTDTLSGVSNGTVESVVEISPGLNRYFGLNAYSSNDVLLYSGGQSTDIGLGESITLNIQMIPQVLMLKVDPMYRATTTLQDNLHYFDIYVYNVENLFGASFRINFSSNLIEPNAVEFGNTVFDNILGSDVLAFSRVETDYVAIGITRKRPAAGVSGSGQLARVYFDVLTDGGTTLDFDPLTASLLDPDGLPVPNSTTIILENGEILISSPTG